MKSTQPPPGYDALIVGAGFSGLFMLHRLRSLGLRARVLEAAADLGGTWYWNRYPGARCDIESVEYSYQFSEELQQDWDWSERHATQPEILRYANHVAERFDLRRDIQFRTRVAGANFDDVANVWKLHTDDGQVLEARFCILATGCLSNANIPDLPGKEAFNGAVYHTGHWPQDGVDFTGKAVGVIGTGSSGIQAIPLIAEQAGHLTVFQRTANYSIPAGNTALTDEFKRTIKAYYPRFRHENAQRPGGFGSRNAVATRAANDASAEEREADFESRWARGGFGFLGGFTDLWTNPAANVYAADFVRNKIRTIVEDSATAELLCPQQVIGCKRICLDTGYYESFNRANVDLVDVRSNPIESFTAKGLRTAVQEFELEVVVFATGFDAMTGSLLKIDISGRGGCALRDAWEGGPRTYLGLGVAGFPNLFVVAGPGSPSVLTNMHVAIDQHVNWISDCIAHLRDRGAVRIEAREDAQEAWVGHGNGVAEQTLYPTCNSWYVGANIPGKPRVFMPYVGGFPAYRQKCQQVADAEYVGFDIQ